MTTPMNIKVSYEDYLNGNYNLEMRAGNFGVMLSIANTTKSASITIGSLDTVNNVFPSIEDAIDYYFPIWGDQIVNYLNGVAGSTVFTLGDKIYYDQKAYDDMKLKVDKTTTINGQDLSSDVVLTKDDVGLSNVDNTSDIDKPISTATQSALDGKVDL